MDRCFRQDRLLDGLGRVAVVVVAERRLVREGAALVAPELCAPVLEPDLEQRDSGSNPPSIKSFCGSTFRNFLLIRAKLKGVLETFLSYKGY